MLRLGSTKRVKQCYISSFVLGGNLEAHLELDHKNRRSSSTPVSVRFYALDGHSEFLSKSSGKELGMSPSLTPSRVESGDGLDIFYAECRQASPAKPWTGTQTEEKRRKGRPHV